MNDPRDVVPLAVPSGARLLMPGSKSDANRLLVAAALSGRETTVRGATPSDDVRHLVAGLATLGHVARFVGDREDVVEVGPRPADAPTHGELFCGNAGTALRFLVSVAAITPGEWTVTGDAHMQKRPIEPLVDAWRRLGIDASTTDGCPPVRIRGARVDGGTVAVDARISSQFVSSLLLVGASLPRGLRLTFDGELASRSYMEWTISVLRRFGIEAASSAREAHVTTGYGAARAAVDVDGDWSSMGAWTCLNHLNGSRIHAANLRDASGQGDEGLAELLAALDHEDEHTIDVEPVPDQFMNLAVVAALRAGTTHLVNAENVRRKECDRIAVMARELQKVGVDLDEHVDGLTIRGGRPVTRAVIDPESDHRVAMAFALLGSVRDGIAIADPGCVSKSYPDFWRDLDTVRREHRCIAIVGMRGAGKTTFGKALADRLGSEFVDSDASFEQANGPIAPFVEEHGWPAFRAAEERIVAEALRPRHVVATGGGAIESEASREALRRRALVVYLEGDAATLRARLSDGDRPSLTGRPVTEELDEVLARRAPLYTAAADVTLAAGDDVERMLAAFSDRRA